MYQSNHNLFKRMRNCFYDVHKWLEWCGGWTSSFENFISVLRNAPKQLRKTVNDKNYDLFVNE